MSRLGACLNFTDANFDGLIVPGGSPPLLIDNKEEVCYNYWECFTSAFKMEKRNVLKIYS